MAGPRTHCFGEILELLHVHVVESACPVDPNEHRGGRAPAGSGEVGAPEFVVDPRERVIADEGLDRRPLPVAVLLYRLLEADHGQRRQPQERREEFGRMILPGRAPDELEQLSEPM